MNRSKTPYLPAILWAIFILIICNMRLGGAAGSRLFFEGFDKITHLGLFFVLAAFLYYGNCRKFGTVARMEWALHVRIWIICAALGGAIELLQWNFFTWRTGEWPDFFCDMLGTSMAVFAFVLLNQLAQREKAD